MKFGAIIVAAGNSTRMASQLPKILLEIDGKTVVERSVKAFLTAVSISSVTVVCRHSEMELLKAVFKDYDRAINFVVGGETRQESVKQGILNSPYCDYFVIHDGARPFISSQLIEAVCRDAEIYGASAAAVRVKDSYKLVDSDNFVLESPNRDQLRAVQTPQVFERELYLRAVEQAESSRRSYTDDCQMVEAMGHKVHLVDGDYRNIKITSRDDIEVARGLAGEGRAMRIGSGYDVHRLVVGRKLILCGVSIDHEKGLLGHSDADVAAHALSDALLGAAGLGDIGSHFPDTDSRYKGADSMELLGRVCSMVGREGYELQNLDITIIAQRPKLAPYIADMRDNIAVSCGVAVEQVAIKATTEEGLGFTGREEGIAAQAVVLLKKI